ncbi:MAG: hypothetical protein O2782_15870 [bacterium]|nr:hypothetical protein [bacterium]
MSAVIPFDYSCAGVLIDRVGGRAILLWDRLGLLILAAITAFIVYSQVATYIHIVVLSVAAGGVIALGMPSSHADLSQ